MSDDFESEVARMAESLLGPAPYTDEWYTVRTWLEYQSRQLRPAYHPNPAVVLGAFELLVTTGHMEAGTDEYGARVFRRRKEENT